MTVKPELLKFPAVSVSRQKHVFLFWPLFNLMECNKSTPAHVVTLFLQLFDKMANEQQSFDLLVSQLMSGENEIRNDAEVHSFLLYVYPCFIRKVFNRAGMWQRIAEVRCLLDFDALPITDSYDACISLGNQIVIVEMIEL